jgi:tRNA(Ile)-lysidine synthase
MLKEFREYISENKMPEPDTAMLLAVSGGIDSMVMADLFLKSGYKSGIAHCNFSLRGRESDLDEDLVRNYAAENNIPFFSIRFNSKVYAKKKGLSVQMAARELRYEWFEKIRIENDYSFIAVAHNLNDNIETLLINLARGTGITGLAGMRPLINNIIRPLLFATRTDIEDYCKKNKLLYREDRSNSDTKYTRNRIRHIIIPELKKINPSIEKTLGETMIRLRETDELFSGIINGIRNSLSLNEDNKTSFIVEKLKNYLHEKTVLFEIFRPYGLSGSQTGDLKDVINGKTGGQLYTGSHRIVKNRNMIVVSPVERMPYPVYKISDIEELKRIPFIASVTSVRISAGLTITDDKMIAYLDENELEYPIVIRKWQKGDYFYPLGMKTKKKISDFLIDIKKSRIEKDKILVLESGGKIAWIIGERIDNRFRIKPSTERALIIKTNT